MLVTQVLCISDLHTKGHLLFLDWSLSWSLPAGRKMNLLLLNTLKNSSSPFPQQDTGEGRVSRVSLHSKWWVGLPAPESYWQTFSLSESKWNVYNCGRHSQFQGGTMWVTGKEKKITVVWTCTFTLRAQCGGRAHLTLPAHCRIHTLTLSALSLSLPEVLPFRVSMCMFQFVTF